MPFAKLFCGLLFLNNILLNFYKELALLWEKMRRRNIPKEDRSRCVFLAAEIIFQILATSTYFFFLTPDFSKEGWLIYS